MKQNYRLIGCFRSAKWCNKVQIMR